MCGGVNFWAFRLCGRRLSRSSALIKLGWREQMVCLDGGIVIIDEPNMILDVFLYKTAEKNQVLMEKLIILRGQDGWWWYSNCKEIKVVYLD